jgi:phage-related holin
MKTIWTWIQTALTVIGGFLGWFLGGLDGFLYALVAFVAIDYFTGGICAIIDKKLSSEIGAKGIFKKVLIFVLVGALRTAIIFFYLSNEGISILENAGHIGLPIPDKLKAILQQLHGRDEEPPSDGDGT